MSVDFPGADPIVLDLGTGLRFWGADLPGRPAVRGHALVTHLHWDHVQGLPFFCPGAAARVQLDIYAPPPESRPPSRRPSTSSWARRTSRSGWPTCPASIRFHAVADADFAIGDVG